MTLSERMRRLLPRGRSLPEEVWQARHSGVLVLLWAHAVAVPVYALVRGFPLIHALAEGAILPAAATLASIRSCPQRVRTGIASLGLLSASAILVHLSGGLVEMHFHFFVMVAVVALYQDWIPFLASIGYVAVHHGVLGALDPESVFNHPAALNHPWRWAAIHALFIAGISAVCLVAWRLNETLFDSERRARTDAEDAQRHLHVLAEATQAVSSSLELDEILANLAAAVVPAVGDSCTVFLTDEQGATRLVAAHAHPELSQMFKGLEVRMPKLGDDNHPVTRVISTGRAELFSEVPGSVIDRAISDRDHREAVHRLGPVSSIVTPIRYRGEVLGAISILTTGISGRTLENDDLTLANELSSRAAVAVHHARQYASEREVAETLQRSLLPEELPVLAGITLAARYRPGGPGVDVGGDWYDVVALPGGSLLLVMGDVVGKGVLAASLMGQLRNALRAYAFEAHPSTVICAKLNDLLCERPGPQAMATLVVARYDALTRLLHIVRAGHLPPLVLEADGSSWFCEQGGGLPLGTLPASTYTEATIGLKEGSTIVFYTDGLVESRGTSLGDGLQMLQRAGGCRVDDLEGLCDHMLEVSLGETPAEDDVAILAMRVEPVWTPRNEAPLTDGPLEISVRTASDPGKDPLPT